MKYCRLVQNVEGSTPSSALRGQYIHYKKLKKILKRMDANAFFLALEEEIHRVNSLHATQRELVLPKKPVFLAWKSTKSRRTLLDRVVWCIAFAEVNATALRKLCKKADKNLGSTRGQQFLQMCWDSNSPRLHAVLRSTLIAELRALESRLLHTLPRTPDASDCDSLTISVDTPSSGVTPGTPCVPDVDGCAQHQQDKTQQCKTQSNTCPSATEADGSEFAFTVRGIPEDALQCAVCMGAVYKPMALSCGHYFCQPCLMRLADLQYHLGPFWLSWACAPKGVCCPQCRAAITETPARMPNLAKLSKHRFGEEWRVREIEQAQWVEHLRFVIQAGNPKKVPIVQHVGFDNDSWCCC